MLETQYWILIAFLIIILCLSLFFGVRRFFYNRAEADTKPTRDPDCLNGIHPDGNFPDGPDVENVEDDGVQSEGDLHLEIAELPLQSRLALAKKYVEEGKVRASVDILNIGTPTVAVAKTRVPGPTKGPKARVPSALKKPVIPETLKIEEVSDFESESESDPEHQPDTADTVQAVQTYDQVPECAALVVKTCTQIKSNPNKFGEIIKQVTKKWKWEDIVIPDFKQLVHLE